MNWKTTVLGILTLLGTAAQIWAHPSGVNANTIAQVAAGVGLIAAKDHNN